MKPISSSSDKSPAPDSGATDLLWPPSWWRWLIFCVEWDSRNRETVRIERNEAQAADDRAERKQQRAAEEQRRATEDQRRGEEERRRSEEERRRSEDRARAENERAEERDRRAEAKEQAARRARVEIERDIALLSFLAEESDLIFV